MHSIVNRVLSAGGLFSAMNGISKFRQREGFVDREVNTGVNWERECICQGNPGVHEVR